MYIPHDVNQFTSIEEDTMPFQYAEKDLTYWGLRYDTGEHMDGDIVDRSTTTIELHTLEVAGSSESRPS